jgi:hypothetical protein
MMTAFMVREPMSIPATGKISSFCNRSQVQGPEVQGWRDVGRFPLNAGFDVQSFYSSSSTKII